MISQSLFKRIDEFLFSYYAARAKRGLLYLVLWLLGVILSLSFVEYWGRFESDVRLTLFALSVVFILTLIYRFVAIPVAAMYRWRNRMDHKEAAKVIGTMLPEVGDVLVNALELGDLNGADSRLIEASLEQKSSQLSHVDFRSAVPKEDLKKLLRLTAFVVFGFVALSLLAPNFVLDPALRVVQYNKSRNDFSPYTFKLPSDTVVSYGSDMRFEVGIEGDDIPRDVYAYAGDKRMRMERSAPGVFYVTLRGLNVDLDISVSANGYSSEPMRVSVESEANWGDVYERIKYPDYLNLDDYELDNFSDIRVPEGTSIEWFAESENGRVLVDGETMTQALQTTVRKDTVIEFELLDNLGKSIEQQRVVVGVTRDQEPLMFVDRKPDFEGAWVFDLAVEDDYGLAAVDLLIEGRETKAVRLVSNVNAFEDLVMFDWGDVDLEEGVSYNLRFRASDNRRDLLGGVVYSRSWTYYEPSKDEVADRIKNQNKEIEKKLTELLEQSQEIENELNDLLDKLQQEGELSWSEKKRLESLIEKQKSLHLERQELSESLREKMDNQKRLDQENSDQDDFNKMVEESIDEEELAKLEELKKLMDELDKDELKEKVEQWKKDQEMTNSDLDRQLELYKRLALEEDIQNLIDELMQLAEKQSNLAEESQEGLAEQDSLSKAFEELSKELDDITKRDQELSDPLNVDPQKQKQSEVSESQSKASESLQNNKGKKANEPQKEAGDKMEEMAQQMQDELDQNSMEQAEEDLEALRQIRENLVRYSFEEERLISEMKETGTSDPHYLELIRQQRGLNDDFKIIEDSLTALSKRVVKLQRDINSHVGEIKRYGNRSIEDYVGVKVDQGMVGQQTIMMHANDLALLLDETQRQMENSMNKMKGMGQCNKPGKGKPSMGEMQKMQQQLSENMRRMEQMLKQQGNKPGQGKGEGQGQSQGQGKSGMSKEMAKAAAEQEALRQQVKSLLEEQAGQGKGSSKLLKELEQLMEENENDLLYKQLDSEFLFRQKEIESKMLEAERAMREEEMEERRESRSADDNKNVRSPELERYLREKYGESERIRRSKIGLDEYYRLRNREFLR